MSPKRHISKTAGNPTAKTGVKSGRRPNPAALKRQRNQIIVAIAVAAVLILLVLLRLNQNRQSEQAGAAAATPQLVGTRKYSAAPPMLIDPRKKYTAAVALAKGGQFVIQLYPDKAPIAVNSFVFLARQGYFDGVTFHRVLEGFMAQGGDPTGTGGGGPGYAFVNEDSDLTFDKAGVVAMANAGRDTNGSQFFITFGPQERLNGGYTIFGQVISGMEVVNGLTRRDPDQNPTFAGDAIQTVTISEE